MTPQRWCITFGIGSRHGKQYTEVLVPPNRSYDVDFDAVHAAAIESYGTAFAFPYPPIAFEASIARYGLTLRETITVRLPDGTFYDPTSETQKVQS